MGFHSETSMKFGRNNTTEKSVLFMSFFWSRMAFALVKPNVSSMFFPFPTWYALRLRNNFFAYRSLNTHFLAAFHLLKEIGYLDSNFPYSS